MINWQTILSSFDDKPTLMQWLKIVEKALQNGTPIYLHTMNVILDDIANTLCQLQILSKDSTKITNVIELQNFVTYNKAILIGFNPNKITYQASVVSDKVFVSVMTLESSPNIITGYVKTVKSDQVAMI